MENAFEIFSKLIAFWSELQTPERLTLIGLLLTAITTAIAIIEFAIRRPALRFISSGGGLMTADEVQRNRKELIKIIQHADITKDQIQDIRTFIAEGRNLMKPDELAVRQLDSYRLHVVAPRPLEEFNEEVYASTQQWLIKRQRDPDARLEFWVPMTQVHVSPVKQILQRLIVDSDNPKLHEKFRIVVVPDEVMSIDYTLWVLEDGKIMAFVNDYDQIEKDYRLWQVQPRTAEKLYDTIRGIANSGTKYRIPLHVPRKGDGRNVDIEAIFVSQVPQQAVQDLTVKWKS